MSEWNRNLCIYVAVVVAVILLFWLTGPNEPCDEGRGASGEYTC